LRSTDNQAKKVKMGNPSSRNRGYLLAALLGAMGGGLVVALATEAIPKMMSRMMPAMMQRMMAQMNEGGCDPVEM
jgi:hypothetical protein